MFTRHMIYYEKSVEKMSARTVARFDEREYTVYCALPVSHRNGTARYVILQLRYTAERQDIGDVTR